MVDKKREIYIKLEKVQEIISLLSEIKEIEKITNNLFNTYDKLNLEENKIFDNWSNYLDEVIQRLEHVTL